MGARSEILGIGNLDQDLDARVLEDPAAERNFDGPADVPSRGSGKNGEIFIISKTC